VGCFGPSLPEPRSGTFGKLKEHIAGEMFDEDDEAKDEVLRWRNEQAAEFYDTCIKKLVARLKCIEEHCDYVEK
jgi:hypothetical protein